MKNMELNGQAIQRILEDFTKLTGIASLAVAPNGKPISKQNGFCKYCDLIRASKEGLKRCMQCDAQGEGFYRCHAGLLDGGSKIETNGKVYAKIKYGQTTDIPLEELDVRKLAHEINVNEEELVNASKAIITHDKEKLRASVDLLTALFDAYSNSLSVYKLTQEKEIAIEKNKTKTDFLSRMSHEIRTPMNAIIGMVALAKDKVNDPEEVRKELDQINESSHYLLGLINDILDVSRIESGRFELHNDWYKPSELLLPVIEMITPLMNSKHIHFVCPTEDIFKKMDVYEFHVDKMRIQQLLINLLNNAYKFTPFGGNIEWISKKVWADDTKCSQCITIKDSGCGMSQELIDQIGTPFLQDATTSSTQLGTGLGLYIVKKIIDASHATLTIHSEKNKGSEFIINLTYPYRKAIVKEKMNKPLSFDALKGSHILIVEDNQINSMIAKQLLEKYGVLTDCAYDGQEALNKFSSSPLYHYDIILMDIRMPIMDGITATKKIRAFSRKDAQDVQIIAMTANAYNNDVTEHLKAGMNDHLSKPIDPSLLYKTLLKHLKKEKNLAK